MISLDNIKEEEKQYEDKSMHDISSFDIYSSNGK